VQVDDTGHGIPPERLDDIFNPFFTTKGGGEGTGLGLSLSLGIVKAHGGHLQAHNLPDAGARFTLSLPIGEGTESRTPPASESLTASAQARILIVDDEEPFRTLLAELIRALGHQVEEAATGHQAMACLEQQNYDLVTLDIRLPDLDGTEIWQWLLAQHAALASRVVFMTGDIMTPETETFLRDAGRPVLIKPLTTAQVYRIVDEVLTQNVS
jgi:CheY-like chemotaxis protein